MYLLPTFVYLILWFSGKNPAAHPLSDKLDYLIPAENNKHQEYMNLLANWEASSEYGDIKLSAIKKYLDGGTIVKDLVREQLLESDKNNKIADKKINGVEPLQCMVRWRVLGTDVEECWRDKQLFQKWASYYDTKMQNNENFITDLCMISGEQEILAPMVPKGIVNKQANAKLISSNDSQFANAYIPISVTDFGKVISFSPLPPNNPE